MATKGVQCFRCGQKWPRDPALEVECPTCNAVIGRKCSRLRPSEHRVSAAFADGVDVHPERDRLAMNLGFLQKCPGEPPGKKE